MRPWLAIVLLGAVAALCACGDSPDDMIGKTAPAGATGASPQSGASSSGAVTRREDRRRRGGKGRRGRRHDDRRREVGGDRRRPRKRGSGRRRGGKPSTYAVAEKVCGEFLLESYVRSHNKVRIARRYARAWPRSDRRSAYRGCLAGLRKSRPRSDQG